MHTHTFTHTYTYINMYLHIYVYIHIRIYMYIYIQGSVDHTGGAGAFSMGSDPNLMKVNVWTNNGKVHFLKSQQYTIYIYHIWQQADF